QPQKRATKGEEKQTKQASRFIGRFSSPGIGAYRCGRPTDLTRGGPYVLVPHHWHDSAHIRNLLHLPLDCVGLRTTGSILNTVGSHTTAGQRDWVCNSRRKSRGRASVAEDRRRRCSTTRVCAYPLDRSSYQRTWISAFRGCNGAIRQRQAVRCRSSAAVFANSV